MTTNRNNSQQSFITIRFTPIYHSIQKTQNIVVQELTHERKLIHQDWQIEHNYNCFPNKQKQALICNYWRSDELHLQNDKLYDPPYQFNNYYLQMLDSFNSMFSKLKSAKLVSTVTDNYHKLKGIVMKKIAITQIIPQLFHIDYPQEVNVEQLVQHTAASPYQIWNISEYRYEDMFEKTIKQRAPQGQIHHLCYQYYSNIPFYELVQAIDKIKTFIASSPAHQVYVHCQDSKVRSGVLLAAYIFQTRAVQVQDISQAILYVNKRLQMQLQDQKGSMCSYKNHHRLFKNLMNYHTNPKFINPHRLHLQTLKINNAPKIKLHGISAKQRQPCDLKLIVQVRNGESVMFKGIFSEAVTQGESICINFQQHSKHITVSDEFLVMVKYSWEKKIYNIFRIQLNTNFIFQQFVRVHQQDIDISVHCMPDKGNLTFIDLTFKEQADKSKLAQLHQLIVIDKKQQKQSVDLLSGEAERMGQCFALEGMDEPQELDEDELTLKIEQVMKSMTLKQEQEQQDNEQQQEQEEDLDDYLSKLESQA